MSLEKQIENEIDKMSLGELLYLELNPNNYIYSKLKPQIDNIKKLEKEISAMKEEFDLLKVQGIDADCRLKEDYEKNYAKLNSLLEERNRLNVKVSKDEFKNLLNTEIKKFEGPGTCFNKFKDGKINYEEFKKQFAELGRGKNYYYYKLIYEKINS